MVTKVRPSTAVPGAKAHPKGNCILVVGMHRSGTSAIARALNLMGAQLPRHLVGGDSSNPSGHWEPKALQELNEALLEEAGSSWDSLELMTDDSLPEGRWRQYRRDASRLISDEYGDASLFVLKDPRVSLLLPFYRKVAEDLGLGLKVVVALRDPAAVAASLRVRNDLGEGYSSLLLLAYLSAAERHTRDLPRVFIDYDTLVDSETGWLRRAIAPLGLQWPPGVRLADRSIRDFLKPELRHHQKHGSSNVGAGTWIDAAFLALKAAPPHFGA